ncbi:P-loop containing nucleoside triphosphate hydrolase protein [Chaetomium fimeti]|uniref:P-loop containing nucleoside triphosphate hydrolase protein n=1 Tax=Chaetomium fimeti TaxID=1854472 RepID=A0AAE0LPK5_9PEZI|nr:P-loop containing nucleoside triphosphate hydrolase protein [Chaetomium fimeti]
MAKKKGSKRITVTIDSAKMIVNLDNGAMQQLQAEQRALLDTIDALRVLGLGKYVDLPQLIVVGDQSAGKSSVLEAISRVRFPIKDGVCTRFATELALRQSPQTKIEVRIQNDGFDTFNRSGFDKDDMPRIIEEAKQHMGITGDSTGFSEDVLRIEIAGPDVPQLTLVDLPGFFHNETENQGIGGVEIVNRLANKYMSQENSIILAVISAQNELAAQKVLGEAKKHDPGRDRTLGILTKPDKVDEESNNEQMYLRLAQNEEASHKLTLGWHVLRNRAPKEADSTDAERDEEEKDFFQGGVWSVVSCQDRGIETLREKLSQVLLSHIQRKLPGLIANIEEHIKTRQTRLKALGDQRSSADDIKKYLINISNRFQRVARDAIHGNYTDDFFGGLYPDPQTAYEDRRVKKLRALVRDLNRAFHFVLTTKGGRRQIQWNNELLPSAPLHLEPLVSLYTLGEYIEISIDDLTEELEKMASENQGVEFPGSSNDKVALALFRDQSASWEAIANQHVDLVTHFSRRFVEELVGYVAGPDTKTADAVIKNLVAPYFEEKQAVLRAKISELLQHYKTGADPQPMHSIFLDSVGRRQNERFAEKLSQLMERHPDLFADKVKASSDDVGAVMRMLATSEVRSEFNAEQTIENAMEYYKMSLRVFTDNVMTLALENCLISDIPNILSPEKVYDMTDDKVTTLAAESKQIRREREELQTQLEKLRLGLAACREHRPRHSNVATLPGFSVLEIRPTLPDRTKPRAPTRPQPTIQASRQALVSGVTTDNGAPVAKGTFRSGLLDHTTATTPATAGATKQNASGGGLFGSAGAYGVPSTGVAASGTSDAPKTGNVVGSSLFSVGSTGGIFGTESEIIAQKTPSNVATTRFSPSGGLFGAPRTGTPAKSSFSNAAATGSVASGGSLFGHTAKTPAAAPSVSSVQTIGNTTSAFSFGVSKPGNTGAGTK